MPATPHPTPAEPGPTAATVVEAGAAAGRDPAFERLLAAYGPALARLAGSYERVASRREELLQEIALALWQALPRFRGECSERTFVYRIAHNRGLTHASRRPPADQPIDDLPESRQPVDPRPHPEQKVAERDRQGRLTAAVQRLPLAHRQVITLMLEDLSQAEIAEVLGITENNVAVRLNRARAALRALLAGVT
jgi:RNA polymerase sigma-70 factor (ECF subfamily)